MKQKFIDMVPKLMKPWVDGSSGTPWAYSTANLVNIGNEALEPDYVVDDEGDMKPVYLTRADVNEAMDELGFNASFHSGPGVEFALAWEVEILSTIIL